MEASLPVSDHDDRLSEGVVWVRQEDAEGCGLATLAMLTGKSYGEVKADIDAQDGHGHNGDWAARGVTRVSLDRYLITHGYYLQRRYAHFYEPGDWPPEPWAPVHFASVKQPSGNSHFVVMDTAGRVLDPMREGEYRLTDWPEVQNVVGLLSAANHAELVEENERLRGECCTCESCGHVQAEPNWCHRCRRRVSFPEWAKRLLQELATAKDEAERYFAGQEELIALVRRIGSRLPMGNDPDRLAAERTLAALAPPPDNGGQE